MTNSLPCFHSVVCWQSSAALALPLHKDPSPPPQRGNPYPVFPQHLTLPSLSTAPTGLSPSLPSLLLRVFSCVSPLAPQTPQTHRQPWRSGGVNRNPTKGPLEPQGFLRPFVGWMKGGLDLVSSLKTCLGPAPCNVPCLPWPGHPVGKSGLL